MLDLLVTIRYIPCPPMDMNLMGRWEGDEEEVRYHEDGSSWCSQYEVSTLHFMCATGRQWDSQMRDGRQN